MPGAAARLRRRPFIGRCRAGDGERHDQPPRRNPRLRASSFGNRSGRDSPAPRPDGRFLSFNTPSRPRLGEGPTDGQRDSSPAKNDSGLGRRRGLPFVLLAGGIAYVSTRPRDRAGRVEIDASKVPGRSSVALDGKPVDRETPRKPVLLPPGDHEPRVEEKSHLPSVIDPPKKPAEILTAKAANVPPPPEPAPFVRRNKVVEKPPARPAPRVAVFEPIPTGAPEDDRETLETLLERPGDFENQVAVPVGMFLLANRAQEHPDGTVTAAVSRVALHVPIETWPPSSGQESRS